MNLITGRTGTDHVLARHDALMHQIMFGDGDFVLNTGYSSDHGLYARVTEATVVTIEPGFIIMQGRLCEHLTSEGISVTPCSSTDLKKKAYIFATYTIDGQGIENVDFEVIEGLPSSNTYLEPDVTYEDGVIDDGETHRMVLYSVYIDGYSIDHIEGLFVVNDTTPIQTALDYAVSNANIVKTILDNLKVEVRTESDDLMASIPHGIRGQWKGTTTVTANTARPISVTMPVSYEYSATDVVDIYLNGLRAVDSEYSVTGEDNILSVTLTSSSFTGQIEAVAVRLISD